MTLQINHRSDLSEIQRLKALLPNEFRSRVKIITSQNSHSALIETKRFNQHQICIQLALNQWNYLDYNQRNLLFWHEISLIQFQRQFQASPIKIVIAIGSLGFLLELLSHNLLGLSTTLSVMAIAVFHLYQQYWGEESIRIVTAADKSAIQLATEFGYSVPLACESLSSVLQLLSRYNAQTSLSGTYQVRLRVLEILQSQMSVPFHSH